MTNRGVYGGTSTSVPWPDAGATEGFGNEYKRVRDKLFNASSLPLTGVAGTGDVVTAALDPVLTAGLVDGMKFTLTWAAANTGGVTLALNGGAAVPVKDLTGAALVPGALAAGLRSEIEYVAGVFVVLTPMLAGGAAAVLPRFELIFTASATWVPPTGLDPDTPVEVELWAGGAGGGLNNRGGGGGGGGYLRKVFRLGDLPSSIAITIGGGGAPQTAGGDTLFGSLARAYGGGPGGSGNTASAGGSGGGSLAAGNPGAATNSTTAGTVISSVSGGRAGGGVGGGATVATGAVPGGDGSEGGGGGGGGCNVGPGGPGGYSTHGGAGGGGNGAASPGAGGLSRDGGNGGASGVAGSAPGGGGGWNAQGARGEARIRI